MNQGRFLVVNADDFGQSPGVNRGVIRAREEGIVRSATLMVRWPAAEEAAAYARTDTHFSLGLHLDLGEWEYTGGEWRPRYEVVDTQDPGEVEAEVERQLDTFRQLVGRDPTHLDSHQHVHRQGPVRTALARAGRNLGVPVRHFSTRIRYLGSFYGQDGRGWPLPDAITVDALVGLLHALPEGITELGCHPGEPDELESTYHTERAVEVETLCDARVRAAVDRLGVVLCSFRDLPAQSR